MPDTTPQITDTRKHFLRSKTIAGSAVALIVLFARLTGADIGDADAQSAVETCALAVSAILTLWGRIAATQSLRA